MLRYLIGHRGASGYEPENTIRSFRRAFQDGANAIELDLRITADGHIVVIHDRTVDRTTNGEGRVDELSLQTFNSLDAGHGEHIATFEEVISLARGSRGTIFAEIKVQGIEEQLLSIVHENDAEDMVVFFGLQSSLPPSSSIRKIHGLDPSIPCTYPGNFRVGVDPLTKENIMKLHDQCLVLIHGDIDDESQMSRLIDLGLDGIITNHPMRLARVVREHREGA